MGNVMDDFRNIINEEKGYEEAARAWAIHSLTTYKGELLRKALMMSCVMMDFLEELDK